MTNKTRTIPLSNGFQATIDAIDFERVSALAWFAKKNGTDEKCVYAAHSQRCGDKVKTIFMHRFIMNCPPGKEVDHGNRDHLYNVRSNLEVVSISENRKRRWRQ